MKMWSKNICGGLRSLLQFKGGASFADTLDFTLKLAYDPAHYSNNQGGEFQAYAINGVPFANQAASVQTGGQHLPDVLRRI